MLEPPQHVSPARAWVAFESKSHKAKDGTFEALQSLVISLLGTESLVSPNE